MVRTVDLASSLWGGLPKPLRFLFVGGVNTVFGYGAYALLLFLGFPFAEAAFAATIIGVLFNYVTTGGLVFENMSRATLFRFVLAYALTYAINIVGLWALGRAGLNPYLAGMILVPPMAVLAYLLMSRFVFGERRVAH